MRIPQVSDLFLVALRLKPGCHETARDLLRVGPPFSSANAALELLEVFLLEDEALFLFDTRGPADLDQLVRSDRWEVAPAWRELMVGGVCLAEPTGFWARTVLRSGEEPHPGLGF